MVIFGDVDLPWRMELFFEYFLLLSAFASPTIGGDRVSGPTGTASYPRWSQSNMIPIEASLVNLQIISTLLHLLILKHENMMSRLFRGFGAEGKWRFARCKINFALQVSRTWNISSQNISDIHDFDPPTSQVIVVSFQRYLVQIFLSLQNLRLFNIMFCNKLEFLFSILKMCRSNVIKCRSFCHYRILDPTCRSHARNEMFGFRTSKLFVVWIWFRQAPLSRPNYTKTTSSVCTRMWHDCVTMRATIWQFSLDFREMYNE